MNCLLRKFILQQLNKVLEDYKNNVELAKAKVDVWLKRSGAINTFLQSLSQKLDDNNLTEEELEAALDELKQMVASWKV